MREKVATELSWLCDRGRSCEEMRNAGVDFPILAGVHLLVRNDGGSAMKESGKSGAAEHAMSAIVVASTEQNY